MTKWIMILWLWICIYTMSFAQVGIGGGGGLNYPGISASELHNSRFVVGAGYDIFIRHRLIKITKDLQLNAKYSVSNYFSDIDLSRVGKTRFNFNYLSIEVLMPFKSINSFVFIGGAGLHLVNVTAVQDYFESNESMIIPSVIIGTEYWFDKNYNVFANLNFQFGEFNDNGQNLPVHGFRLQVGATMFFTE
jgi:hypothetical protein